MSSTSDVAETYKAMNEAKKSAKQKRLESADLTGWTQHNCYHYYRIVNGHKMDYWPSTGLVMYKGKRHNIKSRFVREKLEPQP